MVGNKKTTKGNKGKVKPQVRQKKIKVPVAQGRRITNLGKPKMNYLPNGDVIIDHAELGPEILSSNTASAFSVRAFPINPGNGLLFPWLERVSAGWESYVFEKLEFCYETESTSTTAGAVYMAVDYDVNDTLPADKRTMMAFRGAVRSEVWDEDLRYVCAGEDLHKRKSYFITDPLVDSYVTSQPSYALGYGSDSDARLNHVGNLLLASYGVPTSNTILGEVMIRYRVRLMTPQSTSTSLSQYTLSSSLGYGANFSAIAPFGTALPIDTSGAYLTGFPAQYSTAPISYDLISGYSTMRFQAPSKWYQCSVSIAGSALPSSWLAIYGGAVLPSGLKFEMINSTATRYMAMFYVKSAGSYSGDYGGLNVFAGAGTVTSALIRMAPSNDPTSTPGPSLRSKLIMAAASNSRLANLESVKENTQPESPSCPEPRADRPMGSCTHEYSLCPDKEEIPRRIVCVRCGDSHSLND